MVVYRESTISAHHNYVVNGMATPGFLLGDPYEKGAFYFLADPVLPGEKTHRLHGRLFDETGRMCVEILWNRIGKNPGGCLYELLDGGFRVARPDGRVVLEAWTREYTNGYITYVRGLLFDEQGNPRMKPWGDDSRTIGRVRQVLDTPFTPP